MLHPLLAEEIEYVFSGEEKHIICEEFKVVNEIHRQEGQIISPIFFWQKKNGSIRTILYVKKLNEHINSKLFKMLNFEQSIQLINNGSYIASVNQNNETCFLLS